MNKFEVLYDDSKTIILPHVNEEILVYRIKAIRDFSSIKSGTLGGYVESADNLSQLDDSWICEDGVATGASIVRGNSVLSSGRIFGTTELNDNTYINVGEFTYFLDTIINNSVLLYKDNKGAGKIERSVLNKCVINSKSLVIVNCKLSEVTTEDIDFLEFFNVDISNTSFSNTLSVRINFELNEHVQIHSRNKAYDISDCSFADEVDLVTTRYSLMKLDKSTFEGKVKSRNGDIKIENSRFKGNYIFDKVRIQNSIFDCEGSCTMDKVYVYSKFHLISNYPTQRLENISIYGEAVLKSFNVMLTHLKIIDSYIDGTNMKVDCDGDLYVDETFEVDEVHNYHIYYSTQNELKELVVKLTGIGFVENENLIINTSYVALIMNEEIEKYKGTNLRNDVRLSVGIYNEYLKLLEIW